MKFKKISIIGVGFMGASLSLAIKRSFNGISVWGYARSKKSLYKVKHLNLTDKVTMDLKELVSGSDLVILSVPVLAIVDYFKKIRPFLKKGAFVIDLGSTKNLIDKKAAQYLPKYVEFVGCHPLCGSDRCGPEYADEDLYRDATCIITSRTKAAGSIRSFWKKLGCKVCCVSPLMHDKILSYVSHLPHVISFSLAYLAPGDCLKFSSSSFRDLTRVASSSAEVWSDIFLSNSSNIIKDIRKYIKVLESFMKIIDGKDKKKILDFIKKVNSRQKLNQL